MAGTLGWVGKAGEMEPLLKSKLLVVGTNERIEDGQDMAAVIHHARENITEVGVALCFAMPFGQDCGWNFDVPTQLIRGVAAKEEAVEKRSLALREVEIVDNFGRNQLWHGGHTKNAVYSKVRRRQVGPRFFCGVPGNPYSWGILPSGTHHIARARERLQAQPDCRRMFVGMGGLYNSVRGSRVGRTVGRFVRFGVLRGLRPVEVDPEDFRRELSEKHGLWVPDFGRMKDVPMGQLDAIAAKLIRDAERLALAEGAGFGLGGLVTFLPDASILTVITLRLIQRISLLYGFAASGRDERMEMWKAAASAAGIDYGKDLAEKPLFDKLGPRVAERFAARVGAEAAEKWVGRLIPLASSAIGGALNFAFVRSWGRRVQRHLRAKHTEARASPVTARPSQPEAERTLA